MIVPCWVTRRNFRIRSASSWPQCRLSLQRKATLRQTETRRSGNVLSTSAPLGYAVKGRLIGKDPRMSRPIAFLLLILFPSFVSAQQALPDYKQWRLACAKLPANRELRGTLPEKKVL